MTLQRDKLNEAFQRWFAAPKKFTTTDKVEERFAEVYHQYASDAVDISGDPVISLNLSKFREQLDFSKTSTTKEALLQLDKAFIAYWSGAQFAVGHLPPGGEPCLNTGTFASETVSVVAEVRAKALYKALVRATAAPSNSAKTTAGRLALAMDQATRTAITVLIIGQDSVGYPVYNICTVF